MTVSIGSVVQNTDYNNLVSEVRNILGNGVGAAGYGQLISNLSTVAGSSAKDIAHTEWENLKTQINRCSRHQNNTDQSIGALTTGRIIGADQSGTSVTRVDTGGVITFTHNSSDTTMGVNDFVAAVANIKNTSNADTPVVHPTQVEITSNRAFALSTRTASWGGAGQIQTVDCTFEVTFNGGYNVTNSSDGSTVIASGADHRRHFFNTGGQLRISGANIGATSLKGSDWAVMLQNMGAVVLGKNATTVTGTGRAADGSTDVDLDGIIEGKIGNYQLTTSYQLIFQRNGGGQSSNYAENTINIYARRNNLGDTIIFLIQLNDNDVGDVAPNKDLKVPPSPPGPAVDEVVDGTLRIGLDYIRAAGGFVAVPAPTAGVADELFT
jgi:hypothetical protein